LSTLFSMIVLNQFAREASFFAGSLGSNGRRVQAPDDKLENLEEMDVLKGEQTRLFLLTRAIYNCRSNEKDTA
jgi:hypothetical protein